MPEQSAIEFAEEVHDRNPMCIKPIGQGLFITLDFQALNAAVEGGMGYSGEFRGCGYSEGWVGLPQVYSLLCAD